MAPSVGSGSADRARCSAIETTLDGTASTCLNTDCSASHKEETVTVTTQATVSPVMRLPGLPSTWTVSGKAVQRCLQ